MARWLVDSLQGVVASRILLSVHRRASRNTRFRLIRELSSCRCFPSSVTFLSGRSAAGVESYSVKLMLVMRYSLTLYFSHLHHSCTVLLSFPTIPSRRPSRTDQFAFDILCDLTSTLSVFDSS